MIARHGSCHCGAVRFRFESAAPLAVRACQCSFCRKHGSRNVSDPNGRMTMASDVPLIRYRFGLGITDFLICPVCGSYLAAAFGAGEGCFSTLNLNCLDDPHESLVAEPVTYEGEAQGDRIARRRERWTPTTIIEPEPVGRADA